MNIINKYNLYINSSQRIKGTANSFEISLQKPIVKSNENSKFQFYISSLNYPFSFNQVNNTNNTFTVQLNANPSVLVTISNGNYNILTLLTEVINKTNIALGGIYAFSSSYNKTNGLATLIYSTNDSNSFTFNFANTIIGTMLGFSNNIVLSFGNNQTSDKNVNVNPISYFCIRSNTITSSSNDLESLQSSSEKSNILCKIPINVPSGSYVRYEQPYESRIFSNADILTIIDFTVTAGGRNNPIGNTLDFSFTLICEEFLVNENTGFTKLSSIFNSVNSLDINELAKTREQLINDLKNEKNKLTNNNESTQSSQENSTIQ